MSTIEFQALNDFLLVRHLPRETIGDDSQVESGEVLGVGPDVRNWTEEEGELDCHQIVYYDSSHAKKLYGDLYLVPGHWLMGYSEIEKNIPMAEEIKDDIEKAHGVVRNYPSEKQYEIFHDVVEERNYQDKKFGGPAHDDLEKDENWVAYIKEYSVDESRTFRDRMIAVAALAFAAIESEDRKFPDGY